MKAFSSLKAVLGRLRYLELTSVIRSKIQIHSLHTLERDIQSFFEASGIRFLGRLLTDEQASMGCLRKYRLLDLSFDVHGALPHTDPVDIRFLKEMGFLIDEKNNIDSGPILPGCDDAGLLLDLIKDLDKKTWTIKVFLQDPELRIAVAENRLSQLGLSFKQESYFPHELPIVDACLTNCSMIWLFKHLYL
jgi:hypothetical protein